MTSKSLKVKIRNLKDLYLNNSYLFYNTPLYHPFPVYFTNSKGAAFFRPPDRVENLSLSFFPGFISFSSIFYQKSQNSSFFWVFTGVLWFSRFSRSSWNPANYFWNITIIKRKGFWLSCQGETERSVEKKHADNPRLITCNFTSYLLLLRPL